VHTRVREDAISLFGFASTAEKSLFELYLGINKVGPKVAMNLVGSISPQRLWDAILHDDTVAFSSVPGIGKTTASKILLELKSKEKQLALIYKPNLPSESAIKPSLTPAKDDLDDLHSALSNLGYAKKDVARVVEQVRSSFLGADFDLLMRECLAKLNRPLQKERTEASSSKNEVFGAF
jgi:Holliday junction DNA helicase RuvA